MDWQKSKQFLQKNILDDESEPLQTPKKKKTSDSSSYHSFCDFDLQTSIDEDKPLCFSPLKLGRKLSLPVEEKIDEQFNKFSLKQQPSRQFSIQLEKNKLPDLCYQQNGSRAIQQLIENSQTVRQIIYQTLILEGKKIINHQFGNYVFQKLIDHYSLNREQLISMVYNNFIEYSRNQFGCRVVQKALQYTDPNGPRAQMIIMQLSKNFILLVQDLHANHVVQKAFQIFKDQLPYLFIQKLVDKVDSLAFQGAGCRVVQKCLQFSSPIRTQELRVRLREKMLNLCQCQYGNYIISNIVQQGCPDDIQFIQKKISQNVLSLSTDKYASNVVQKSITKASQNFRQNLYKKLQVIQQGQPILNKLARDKYGNYVIKRMFLSCSKQLKNKFRILFKEQASNLTRSYYGNFVMRLIIGR